MTSWFQNPRVATRLSPSYGRTSTLYKSVSPTWLQMSHRLDFSRTRSDHIVRSLGMPCNDPRLLIFILSTCLKRLTSSNTIARRLSLYITHDFLCPSMWNFWSLTISPLYDTMSLLHLAQ